MQEHSENSNLYYYIYATDTTLCSSEESVCDFGLQCVNSSLVCDSLLHCRDFSDELGCCA